MFGQIKAEGSDPRFVIADHHAVQVDIGRLADAFELDEHLPAGEAFRQGESFPVKCDPPPHTLVAGVVGYAAERIHIVERMGQAHIFPGRVIIVRIVEVAALGILHPVHGYLKRPVVDGRLVELPVQVEIVHHARAFRDSVCLRRSGGAEIKHEYGTNDRNHPKLNAHSIPPAVRAKPHVSV